MHKALILLFILFLSLSANAEVSIRIKSNYESGVEMYQKGNIKMALIFFEQGVNDGDANCESALGTHYFYGDGVKKDINKALQLFEKSANKGDPLGNAMLGFIYAQGDGVTPDDIKSHYHARKAAEACLPQSQDLVAKQLYNGTGVTMDKVQALAWLYSATTLGNESSANGVVQIESELTPEQIQDAKQSADNLLKGFNCINK